MEATVSVCVDVKEATTERPELSQTDNIKADFNCIFRNKRKKDKGECHIIRITSDAIHFLPVAEWKLRSIQTLESTPV